jgi:hypothetical protein
MGSFLRYRAAQIFGLCTIFNSKMYVFNFDQKKSLATFWATFSQTHLVALIRRAVKDLLKRTTKSQSSETKQLLTAKAKAEEKKLDEMFKILFLHFHILIAVTESRKQRVNFFFNLFGT